jgi:NhaP-type Na+/H+ or K+/H+ antiporter
VTLPGDSLYLVGGAALLLGAVLPTLLSRQAISVPMAFVGAGVLVGLLPLPGGLAISPIEQPVVAERLTEACVIIALMGVGLAIDRPLGLRGWSSTWRLLAIGMPLFIAGAALLGWWVLGLAPATAVLLGAVLAPTDPVLASDVRVAGPRTRQGGVADGDGTGDDEQLPDDVGEVDEKDQARFSLTSEAGLNDGLAFPSVYAAIMVAAGTFSGWHWLGWELLGKVVLGALIGWGSGWLLARMAFRSSSRSFRLAETGEPMLALAATFVVYGLTEVVGGYGFLAVFVAALAIRSHQRSHEYHDTLHAFVAQLEHLLTLLLLLLFGASLSWGLLSELTWWGAAVGAAVVLLLRPLTAAFSLLPLRLLGRTGLSKHETGVVAFFGVRGIGTLYYMSYATGQTGFDDARGLWSVVGFTVLLSIVVHGVLATPVMRHLDGRRDQGELSTTAESG